MNEKKSKTALTPIALMVAALLTATTLPSASGFQLRTETSPRALLQPKLTGPVTIRMNQPSRVAYETLADLAGIQVIFHRQFQSAAAFAFNVENVDIFDALDILSFQTGNFWQVRDAHTIVVATDNPTVRRDVEPMILKTFYLTNVIRQQELTELVTMLRTLLQINQVTMSTPLNAITVRDTPDKIALVEKLIGNSGLGIPSGAPSAPAMASAGDGGLAAAARIPSATAIAADGKGTVFVLDRNHVRKITPDGVIRSVDNLYAADIAADADGNLYIADDLNHRIRKRTPEGALSTIAGDGRAGSIGDGGPAASARLNAPKKLAVDRDGVLYIADSGNGRIRKVTAKGVITTLAGNGAWGFAGDGGSATAARIGTVSSMAASGDGNLYFGDGSSRVRKVTAKGIISTIAGTGTAGFSGDGGAAASAQIEVAGLAMDTNGNLFIAAVNRIRRVTPDGTIRTLAGNGAGYEGDGGPAASARLNGPRAIAVDPSGALFVADTFNGRIRKITVTGTITTIAGSEAP